MRTLPAETPKEQREKRDREQDRFRIAAAIIAALGILAAVNAGSCGADELAGPPAPPDKYGMRLERLQARDSSRERHFLGIGVMSATTATMDMVATMDCRRLEGCAEVNPVFFFAGTEPFIKLASVGLRMFVADRLLRWRDDWVGKVLAWGFTGVLSGIEVWAWQDTMRRIERVS